MTEGKPPTAGEASLSALHLLDTSMGERERKAYLSKADSALRISIVRGLQTHRSWTDIQISAYTGMSLADIHEAGISASAKLARTPSLPEPIDPLATASTEEKVEPALPYIKEHSGHVMLERRYILSSSVDPHKLYVFYEDERRTANYLTPEKYIETYLQGAFEWQKKKRDRPYDYPEVRPRTLKKSRKE